MHKVIDSNFLQREELRVYLAKSAQNYAVLTDYAAMEAYKGNTLASIFPSMAILAKYPKQVVILKNTTAVCGLKGHDAGLRRRMIDERSTLGFPDYCRHLDEAKRGNAMLQKQLLDYGEEASRQMSRILADVAGLPAAIDGIAQDYSASELRIFRTGGAYTKDMMGKMITHILDVAECLFRNHPRALKLKGGERLSNKFFFRTALCGYLLNLRWIAVGGAKDVKPERLRNDIVDINFAAFGTYFDGFFCADKKLCEIYDEAVIALQAIAKAERASI